MSLLSRFPSYDIVIKGAAATFRRYPLALVSAFLATAAAIYLVEIDNIVHNYIFDRLLAAGALGIALFTALTNFAERRRWGTKFNLLLQAGGAVLLFAYYFSLPENMYIAEVHWIRFALLAVGLHFLVAVLPYSGTNGVEGFWRYNKTLFIRLLTSALYSGVLYIGLAIALAAANHLFGLDVEDQRYFQTWIIIVGVFNTWVFLSGIPEDLNQMSDSSEYPKGLKVFTQYILLPLVVLYFVILIAYEAKIIVQWNWPKGWVSHLVLWYSVVGILSSLLLHPLRETSGNRWILAFTKWFYRALVPLVVLLFLAIMRRISEYGITENRYFVLAMAVGLSVVVIYFIFSKAKDIRIIPGVLCLIAFLSAYGPWSSFVVSKSSQQGRLQTMMETHSILVEGEVQPATGEIPFEDKKQMSSIIRYLNYWHGTEAFSRWFSDSSLAALDSTDRYGREKKITEAMGFEWIPSWKKLEENGSFSIDRATTRPVSVAGYDHLVEIDLSDGTDSTLQFEINGRMFTAVLDGEALMLTISTGDVGTDETATAVDLGDMFRDLIKYPQAYLKPDQMTYAAENDRFDIAIVFDRLSGSGPTDSLKVWMVSADLLLRLK